MEKISPKKEKKDENPTKTRLMKQADAQYKKNGGYFYTCDEMAGNFIKQEEDNFALFSAVQKAIKEIARAESDIVAMEAQIQKLESEPKTEPKKREKSASKDNKVKKQWAEVTQNIKQIADKLGIKSSFKDEKSVRKAMEEIKRKVSEAQKSAKKSEEAIGSDEDYEDDE